MWHNPVGADPTSWGPPNWINTAVPPLAAYADTGQHIGLYVGRVTASFAGSFDDVETATLP